MLKRKLETRVYSDHLVSLVRSLDCMEVCVRAAAWHFSYEMEQQKTGWRKYLSWRSLPWLCGSLVFPYIFAMLFTALADIWQGPSSSILLMILGAAPVTSVRVLCTFLFFMAGMTAIVKLAEWWTDLWFPEEKTVV